MISTHHQNPKMVPFFFKEPSVSLSLSLSLSFFSGMDKTPAKKSGTHSQIHRIFTGKGFFSKHKNITVLPCEQWSKGRVGCFFFGGMKSYPVTVHFGMISQAIKPIIRIPSWTNRVNNSHPNTHSGNQDDDFGGSFDLRRASNLITRIG